MACGKLQSVCRRKVLDPEPLEVGKLKRCLGYWDVTSLGVGSTLGAGVYVLVGAVAYRFAGPSVLLSFLMAAVAALFAGVCYAELGARVPLAGSVYAYTYVTVGQIAAFIVGWSSILEFVFGAASIARGLSLYIDTMVDNAISTWFIQTMPLAAAALSTHFDLLSFVFTLALGVLLALGVRQSATVNNVFSVANVLIILIIIVLGAIKASTGNWSVLDTEVPVDHGSGGFFPHGVWGTVKGAAVCFYGFVGFTVINYSAEEVREPRRTIPLAILSVLFTVFAVYASFSIILTMMVPYYQLDGVTSVATAFTLVGWEWGRWVVAIGAVFGLCTSLFGSLYPLPRLLYSMASDGLFIHWFAKVSERNQSPIVATLIPAVIIALLSAILDLEQLVLLMCFGTLFSFIVVASCVVLLRYRSSIVLETSPGLIKQICGHGDKLATKATSNVVAVALVIYISLCISIAAVGIHAAQPLIPSVILHALAVLVVVVMALQPKAKEKLDFKAPLVPFIPCLSIYANINLMVVINLDTWIIVAIWLLIGIPVFILCLCCYNQKLSKDYDPKDHITNGKPPVQIVVESPTPPSTIAHSSNHGDLQNEEIQTQEVEEKAVRPYNEEIAVQQVVVEYEEKEAKIIDLLDQVLQAEEDSYGEVISLKENKETESTENNPVIHRKSLSELSDAGSDASMGNQVLSKYDVIAQVHREDLPKVNEEEEKAENNDDIHNDDYEEVTAFNDSETNSRTDESGYSDTIDRTPFNELIEDNKHNLNIPVPPPMDENYFKTKNYLKFNTVPAKSGYSDTIDETPLNESIEDNQESFFIPVPPSMDENYFKPTNYPKFNTVPSKYSKQEVEEEEDDDQVNQPRESVQSNKSNGSYGDGNMRFGSDRQIKFMSKLNDIFQNKMASDEEEPRKRSHSTGTVPDVELSVSRDRPSLFLDLKKELLAGEAAQNLRPINTEEKAQESEPSEAAEPEVAEDISMSRDDLKSKLENIFATGGPQLLKPRLMKSNPPTPEEAHTDTSSTESLQKLPKIEKNDTLKRQKAKFGEVLNSFRLSFNKDDDV